MPSTFDLTGKVVIVTGASSGIGLATAELLLASKATVFAADIAPLKAQSLLDAAADTFYFHQADLAEPPAAEALVAKCQERFGGKIDALLNVAGIMDNYGAVDVLQDSMLDRLLDVNLKAPIRLMRHAIPVMVKNGGGAIVNVSSKAGSSGAAAGIAYTASKHGLVGATKNTAWQFRDAGIRCNAVAPGGVQTNIVTDPSTIHIESFMRSKDYTELIVGQERPPMQAIDIANSIVFLISDLSANISGVVLPIDKAWSTM